MKKYLVPVIITLAALLLLAAPVWVNADGTEVTGNIPLVILSDPTYTNVTSSGVTISWTTNGASSSQVYYRVGSTGVYSNQTGGLGPNNSVTLGGLSASTNYQYYVYSSLDGLTADSSLNPGTFTTSAADGGGSGSGGGGGGHGGGGGPKFTDVSLNSLKTSTTLRVDSKGVVEAAASIATADYTVKIDIAQGSILLNSAGSPLASLDILSVKSPEPPSESAVVVTYNFLPEGASFSPALNINLTYDVATLPAGVSEKDLYVAWWDGVKWWQKTDTVVNTVNHTIAFKLDHFSQYSVIGKIPPATPVVTTTTTTTVKTTPIPSTTPVVTPVTTAVPASPTPTPSSTPPAKPVQQGLSSFVMVLIFVGIFVVVSLSTVLIILRWRRTRL